MDIAKLFQNGQSQAVRLPKAFRFEGDRVFIRRFGNAVVLMPYTNPWDLMFSSLELFSPDFMIERSQPRRQEREPLF